MTTNTILLLILSFLLAGGLSFFQYYYKAKTKLKVNFVLAFLRFLSLFALFLLLVNPVITHKTLEISKTPLPIVVDNSSSIVDLHAQKDVLKLFKKLSENNDLQNKFDVKSYQFDLDFQQSDAFNFKGSQTNLDAVAKSLKRNSKNKTFPTVIITDGNQTSGNDYVYSFDGNNAVFPLIVGDTTQFFDVKINQLHVNRYAFHKNKFPVEIFLHYSGKKSINTTFSITQGNSILSTQSVSFNPSKKTALVSVLIPADKLGLQLFKAKISSKEKEKNSYNNIKNFTVEVINQKTNVAIVSTINHPDIGALKRSIESNAQRKVTIVKPNDPSISGQGKQTKTGQDFNILILYQPTTEFKSVFENSKSLGINTFVITGIHTDFNFLNQQQSNLNFKMSSQKEDYFPEFNSQFTLFALENFGFENFPPLQNPFGSVSTKGAVSTLLSSKIRTIQTQSPLLSFVENQNQRSAFLIGENLWKWRLQSHINQQSFDKFDVFIDKIIQFLVSNNSKKSLVVTSELVYFSGNPIEISAQYFNKNYEFDEKARLTITLKNTKTNQTKNYDLLKANTFFKVNLDGLTAGKYDFTVKEINSNTSYSGHFEVLDFDIEKQFVNPDVEKLTQLATQTKGKMFHPDQVDALIKALLANDNYKPTQKEISAKTPLIDWVWLLVLLAIALASEWFVRKYNGML